MAAFVRRQSGAGCGKDHPRCRTAIPTPREYGAACPVVRDAVCWRNRSIAPLCRRGAQTRGRPRRSFRSRERNGGVRVEYAGPCRRSGGFRTGKQEPVSLLRDWRRRCPEIAGEDEKRAIAHPPMCENSPGSDGARMECVRAVEAGNDLGVPQRKQLSVEPRALARTGRMRGGLGTFEIIDGIRVRNLRKMLRVGEFRKARELPTPALAYGYCEVRLVVGKEQEWRCARLFLAHENKRDLRT